MTPHCADTVSRRSRHTETETQTQTETGTRDGDEISTENFTEKKTFTVISAKSKNRQRHGSVTVAMGSGERSLSPSVSAKLDSAVQGELDLKARVFAFPPSRRTDRVRVVAGMIEGMKGPEATRYWKRTVKAIGRQLASVGIPADEIERQQRQFFDAVQQELVRRSYRDCGGAA